MNNLIPRKGAKRAKKEKRLTQRDRMNVETVFNSCLYFIPQAKRN